MKKIIAIAFILLILALGCVQQKNPPPIPEIQEKTANSNQRNLYGLPSSVFEELPSMPKDFNKIVSLTHRNVFKNYGFFSREYFLQPEFYPSFIANGLTYWLNPNPSRVGIAGIGFYPSIQSIQMQKSKISTACFFVHAAFGVQSFQGIKIEAETPGNIGELEVDVIDSEFLLGPTFPKISKDWAKKVCAKIEAGNSAKNGEYQIKFFAASPSAEKSAGWKNEFGRKYFETYSAGANVSHTIIVKIE